MTLCQRHCSLILPKNSQNMEFWTVRTCPNFLCRSATDNVYSRRRIWANNNFPIEPITKEKVIDQISFVTKYVIRHLCPLLILSTFKKWGKYFVGGKYLSKQLWFPAQIGRKNIWVSKGVLILSEPSNLPSLSSSNSTATITQIWAHTNFWPLLWCNNPMSTFANRAWDYSWQ